MREIAESGAVVEHKYIVIVGGGICGLATALALHRKGIESIVIEKSEKLRATGAAIIVQPNGWRALEQLGVAYKLGRSIVPVYRTQYIGLDNGECKELTQGVGATRCLRPADLLQTLSNDLPPTTVRFGCKVQSIDFDRITSLPKILLDDDTTLHAKVVIGCDGVNSAVGNFLGMKSRRFFSTCVIRGVTRYSHACYKFHNKFVVMKKGNVQFGRMPMDESHFYWFVTRPQTSQDSLVSKDPNLIQQSTIKYLFGFPEEEVDLVRKCYLDHLYLTPLYYHAPWDLLITKRLKNSTITLAGDAMHAMGPFIAQGGSSSLEDAVVFSRCFSKMTCGVDSSISQEWKVSVEVAIDRYIRERKMRILRLSTQAFLIGTMVDGSSVVAKFLCGMMLRIFFPDSHSHTSYDCGQL